MKEKILSTKTLLLIIFMVGIFYVVFSYFFKKNNVNDNLQLTASLANLSTQRSSNFALPVRLKIPNIKVDAPFEYVGLTPDGAMDVPKGPNNVAWFNLGPRPGDIGSSVVAGHSGYKDNRPAVFDNLDKLQIGDKVYVEDLSGAIIVFIVREIRIYNPKANAGDVFSSNDNQAHLNLITCTGIWNKIDKTHADRLVVFTDLEVI